MTPEEKQLLLKDLCARLPYEVKILFRSKKGDIASTIIKIDTENRILYHIPEGQSLVYMSFIEFDDIKPYLRSINSMTEKEKEEWIHLRTEVEKYTIGYDAVVDFYNEHHFDYRGLILMGLALEAPEGMYKNV